jgi:hypothetical protein
MAQGVIKSGTAMKFEGFDRHATSLSGLVKVESKHD